MNNENYIVINGKKTELTEEQLKQLRIEVEPKKRNNPFGNFQDEHYYYTNNADEVCLAENMGSVVNDIFYYNSNHFNDKAFARQVMLHQQLYRKLLKYAYDNNAQVTKKDWGWENDNPKYFIYCELYHNTFYVDSEVHTITSGTVHFKDETVAEQAIKDVVEPFIKEHPEFVW